MSNKVDSSVKRRGKTNTDSVLKERKHLRLSGKQYPNRSGAIVH